MNVVFEFNFNLNLTDHKVKNLYNLMLNHEAKGGEMLIALRKFLQLLNLFVFKKNQTDFAQLFISSANADYFNQTLEKVQLHLKTCYYIKKK